MKVLSTVEMLMELSRTFDLDAKSQKSSEPMFGHEEFAATCMKISFKTRKCFLRTASVSNL